MGAITPEALFHMWSGLGTQWEVVECEFEAVEGVVRLWIEETPSLWNGQSIGAKVAVTAYDHTGERVWRRLNVFEHRCEIRCRLPRGHKATTGPVYRVLPPAEGMSKHFTQAFEAMALLLMQKMPVAAVARHVEEIDTRLWRMLKAQVAAANPKAN